MSRVDFRELLSLEAVFWGILSPLGMAWRLFIMASRKLRMASLLETVDQVYTKVDEGVKRRASLKYSIRDTLHSALCTGYVCVQVSIAAAV